MRRRRFLAYALAAILALSTLGADSCSSDTFSTDGSTETTETSPGSGQTTPQPPTETTTEETTTETPPTSSDCEPGYDPCVPPYPPDVDCSDISGPVTVTGSDPHRLDADGNGIGCE
jgi:hypothetical protein